VWFILCCGAGVKLQRQSGLSRANMHPLLQGQDPVSYKRRHIVVTPATKQGKRAVGQLLAQQQQQQQQLGTQELQQVVNGAESNAPVVGSDRDSVSDTLYNSNSSNATHNVAFMVMLAQLQRWKKRHGSCYVPAGVFDKPQLAQWVAQMRQLRAAAAAAAAAASSSAGGSDEVGDGGSSIGVARSTSSSRGDDVGCNRTSGSRPVQWSQSQQQQQQQQQHLQAWQVQELDAVGFVWQPSQVSGAVPTSLVMMAAVGDDASAECKCGCFQQLHVP
jgi:hypothetical protein